MKIFCLDSPYAQALEQLGHTVNAPKLPQGIMHLPGLLKHLAFEPDLVIQHERLGPRLILSGLEEIKCPTVFVSIDAHLNMFWHKYYAKLFDVVFTPHISLYNALPSWDQPKQLLRLGPRGYARPFRPFAERSHPASFTGVLTVHRPARQAMVSLLSEHCGLYWPTEYLKHDQMLELFADSRIIPNESIALEVNYRLFEAASCGAVVLSQNIGEDQNVHFKPGTEFETYDNAIELVEKIKFLNSHVSTAEKIGRAAWERVQRQHLDEHRAGELLRAANSSQARATGEEATRYLWLTLAQLSRNRTLPLSFDAFMKADLNMEQNPHSAAMKINLLMEATFPKNWAYSKDKEALYRAQTLHLLATLLKGQLHAGSPECNLAGAMAAYALGKPELAKIFWLRQLTSLKEAKPHLVLNPREPKNAYEHYLTWGKLMAASGYYTQSGFGFQGDNGLLPGCAFECLVMAQKNAMPQQHEWLVEQHKVCAATPGYSFFDMGFLADLSLRMPESWHYQLLYGNSCLQNYRLEEGLHEVAEAREKSVLKQESEPFEDALEALPGSGYIRAAL